MDLLEGSAIVLVSLAGGVYAAWVLRDGLRKTRAAAANTTCVGARKRSLRAARFDGLSQLVVAGLFLAMAVWGLAGVARPHLVRQGTGQTEEGVLIPGLPNLAPGRICRASDLPGSPITDADLSGLPLTSADVRMFLQQAPEIAWLNLSDTQIGDEILADLAAAPSLVRLSLSRTGVSDAGIRRLAGSAQMEFLLLDETRITDAGVASLKSMANLRWLSLRKTEITPGCLEVLEQFENMERLNLNHTAITGVQAQRLVERRPRLDCHCDKKEGPGVTGEQDDCG